MSNILNLNNKSLNPCMCNFHQLHQTFIVFPKGNIQNFQWKIKTIAPILVFTEINNEMDLHQMNVSIDMEMYFIDGFSLKMYESYMVNNVSIKRYLGQFLRSQENNNENVTICCTCSLSPN